MPCLDKEQIVRMYHSERMTTAEISKVFGVTPKKILYFMEKNGIPRRGKKEVVVSDLTDKTFGKLKVVRRAIECETNRGAMWLCKCICGGEKIVRGTSLSSGNTTSCGCNWKTASYQEISGTYWWSLKDNAKKRNLEFSITQQDIWKLYLSQNKKCALSNVDLTFGKGLSRKNQTASLDRIDSSKGYVKNNIRWVHKDVNQMKWNMSDEIFLDWVKKIYQSTFYNKK